MIQKLMKIAKYKIECRYLLKRPVISVFIFYAAFLIALNTAGIFETRKQSFLYYFTDYEKSVEVQGKVISVPEFKKNGQRFIINVTNINSFNAGEMMMAEAPPGYQISYGDIIRLEGKISKPKKADFPLVFDYRQYLARLGIYTVFRVYSFEFIESKPNPVQKSAFLLQQDVVKKIDNYFKKPYADILKPVIIGDKSSLDTETKNNFTDAGLMHILVVSGLNVGFIGAMFLILFKLSGLSLKKASLLCIPFIFLYALATGANPPVMRAAIMFSCILISLALDREPLIYNSLALSALIILLFQPQQLFTASFQMSYAATIGIVYFYNAINGIFKNFSNKILKFFCGVFAVTVAAQIPIIPVCLYYFGKVSLISFISNIIIVPLIGLITSLGFIFYLLTFIFSYAALFLSVLMSIMIHFILISVNFMGQLKYASVPLPKPHIFQILMFFLFIFFITRFKNKKRFIMSASVLLIVFLSLIIPKFIERNRLIFSTYYGQNMTVFQLRSNLNIFVIYQQKKYDKYYVDSFKQFLDFSGIKYADISAIGIEDEDMLKEQLQNMNIAFQHTQKPPHVEFNFDDNNVFADMYRKKLLINDFEEINLGDNPSFCYNIVNKKLKIKKSRNY